MKPLQVHLHQDHLQLQVIHGHHRGHILLKQKPKTLVTLRDQRALTIGRALGGEPKLLLLDEPAAALNYEEIKELGRHFLRYKEQGIAILLIDHRMEIVMSISDRVIVFNFGRKIAEGTPAEIQDDREVLAVYLGEKAVQLP